MYPVNLYLKNFLSFEEQKYEFLQGKPVLIQGRNLSEESQESNGSGKSGLQNALEFLLLNTTSRDCRDNELIRDGEDVAVISCEIYCTIRKESLFISKTISKKDSCKVLININNESKINTEDGRSKVNDANNFIINWLDIEKEDLQNYFIINKERYTSFFKSSNTKKIATVGRFSNFSIVNPVFDKLKIESDLYNNNDLIKKRSELDGKLQVYESQLQIQKNRNLEVESEELIFGLKNKIKDKENENIGFTNKISEIEGVLKKYEDELLIVSEQIKTVKELRDNCNIDYSTQLNDYNNVLSESKDLNLTFTNIINSLNFKISHYNTILSGLIKCPNCKHEFSLDYDGNVSEISEIKIPECELGIKENNRKINECKDIINSLTTEISIIKEKDNKQNEERNKLLKELNELNGNISTISTNINSSKICIENNRNRLKSNSELIDKYKEDIKNIKIDNTKEIVEIEINILNTKNLINDYDINIKLNEDKASNCLKWINYFKKFISYLSQESLIVIQNNINYQLEGMKSSIKIKLEGFKQKVDGTLKEEITPYIIKSGVDTSYGKLSGGEKVRIDLATVIALQNIINSTNRWGGLDLLWMDEITESLDGRGLRYSLKAMEPLQKTILLTTHITLNDIYDNILMVENRNDISQIV